MTEEQTLIQALRSTPRDLTVLESTFPEPSVYSRIGKALLDGGTVLNVSTPKILGGRPIGWYVLADEGFSVGTHIF